METRVGGTDVGQRWRVTGFQPDEPIHPDNVAMVALEFWLQGNHGLTYHQDLSLLSVSPLSFDPSLARSLGEHLIEMADHAEGVVMGFKVGDLIRRGYSSRGGAVGVVQGATYEVAAISSDGEKIKVKGNSQWYDSWKFSIIESFDH